MLYSIGPGNQALQLHELKLDRSAVVDITTTQKAERVHSTSIVRALHDGKHELERND